MPVIPALKEAGAGGLRLQGHPRLLGWGGDRQTHREITVCEVRAKQKKRMFHSTQLRKQSREMGLCVPRDIKTKYTLGIILHKKSKAADSVLCSLPCPDNFLSEINIKYFLKYWPACYASKYPALLTPTPLETYTQCFHLRF